MTLFERNPQNANQNLLILVHFLWSKFNHGKDFSMSLFNSSWGQKNPDLAVEFQAECAGLAGSQLSKCDLC